MAKEKLFGFNLNDTSALLLFIFALMMLFGGAIGIVFIINTYNATGTLPPFMAMGYGAMTLFGLYILMKTVAHRNKR